MSSRIMQVEVDCSTPVTDAQHEDVNELNKYLAGKAKTSRDAIEYMREAADLADAKLIDKKIVKTLFGVISVIGGGFAVAGGIVILVTAASAASIPVLLWVSVGAGAAGAAGRGIGQYAFTREEAKMLVRLQKAIDDDKEASEAVRRKLEFLRGSDFADTKFNFGSCAQQVGLHGMGFPFTEGVRYASVHGAEALFERFTHLFQWGAECGLKLLGAQHIAHAFFNTAQTIPAASKEAAKSTTEAAASAATKAIGGIAVAVGFITMGWDVYNIVKDCMEKSSGVALRKLADRLEEEEEERMMGMLKGGMCTGKAKQ